MNLDPVRRSVEVPGLHHGGVPIPQAAVVRGLLMSGGISPIDPVGGDVPADVAAQVRQAFANARAIVEAAGGQLADIVKFTVFVEDKSIRADVDVVWLEYFPDETSRPARHTQRADLPGPLHIQLDFTAVLGEGTAT